MPFMIFNGRRNEMDCKTYDTLEEVTYAFFQDLGVPNCETCSNRIHCLVDPDCIHTEGFIWELPDVIDLKVSPAWFAGMGSIVEVFDKIPGSKTWSWTADGFKLDE